jgi:hypothetical protein
MLRDHKNIELVAGQSIIVEAVGAKYTEFEGYKDDKETRIGLSYDKLCQSVVPGEVQPLKAHRAARLQRWPSHRWGVVRMSEPV